MIVLRDSSRIPASCRQAVLALGNFDGLHRGHQEILATATRIAREQGKPAGVITFEPHPRLVFNPAQAPLRILTLREKLQRLQRSGIDFVRIVHFTRRFAQTSAKSFVQRLLYDELGASHIVTGEDFTFGHQRSGNAALLHSLGKQLHFATTACSAVNMRDERCSSTRLRTLLAAGNMHEAAQMLGRAYRITGRVQNGDKRGRELGFPTANILPQGIFLPAFGVYAVRAEIDGKTVTGVAHLGPRPVFDSAQVRLETHFFDFSDELYGKRLEIEFLSFLRGEKSLNGIEALKAQIAEDCAKAKIILGAW